MAKNNPVMVRNEQEEYVQIQKDFRFVVVMNALFLIALIALYFFNRSTGKVDTFFAHLLRF